MAQAKRQLVAAGFPGSTWRVLLEGDLLVKARETVEEIAAALAVTPTNRSASAPAERALLQGYLAQVKRDAQTAERALQSLNAAIDQVGSGPLLARLIGGYPQVGWVITQLAGRLFAQDEAEVCSAIDEALLDYLSMPPRPIAFDLIGGLAGLGVYALARVLEPNGVECLRRVVEALDACAERSAEGATWFTAPELLPQWQREICPSGHYNLGLAHGVPGVIALLGRACAVEEVRPTAAPLLAEAVRWLLAHLGEEDGAPFFPTWIAPGIERERGRVAWCYGDLGAATALLDAALSVGRADWAAVGLRSLRFAAARRDRAMGVRDAGLCHGAAGNAHLFNRIYQATGEDLFADAARYWFARVFDFHQPQLGFGGFGAFQANETGPGEWVECVDLVDGAAGIGLALLAASSTVAPDWDACLAVSLPPLLVGRSDQPRGTREQSLRR